MGRLAEHTIRQVSPRQDQTTRPTLIVNGQVRHEIDALDRGLQYGDGLFETIAVIQGACRFWEEHMARLLRGCRALRIPPPNPHELAEEAKTLVFSQAKAVLKIILTRGVGGRGYRPPREPDITRMLALLPWPVQPQDAASHGVTVRVCHMRLGRNRVLAGIKHLNRLEQVLARNEWEDAAIVEGLMLDSDGHLVEGTMSNVFCVKEGVLLTPALTDCGVAGITRGRILANAETLGVRTRVNTFSLDEFLVAEEAFICNSLIGIWPICQLLQGDEATRFTVGEVTRHLQSVL